MAYRAPGILETVLSLDRHMNRETDRMPHPLDGISVSLKTKSPESIALAADSAHLSSEAPHAGLLIVNADDRGRDREGPDRISYCGARQFVVEVETHPVNRDEYRFLTGREVAHWM